MRKPLFLALLLAAASAQAEVYKWVDKDGTVHYTDEPPTQNAKPAKLPPLQTYKQGTEPSLDKFEPAPAKAAAPTVKIVSPAPDTTYRLPLEPVPVAVQASGLGPGLSLLYQVNGTTRGGPTAATAFSVTGLERGAHSISVAIVDAAGKEVARSAPVTVHMKPPTVRN